MLKLLSGLIGSFLLFFFFSTPNVSFANHIPAPTGYVNDFAGVLTAEQKSSIEQYLSNYEKQSGNEIAIAFVKSLNGDDIDDFTVRAFEEWKIGKKGKDNGILFLAAIDNRKMRIEVGYGLEPEITDSQAGAIIREVVAPEFKNGNYFQGTENAVNAIINEIGIGQDSSGTKSSESASDKAFSVLYIVLSFAFFMVYLSAFLARSKSIWGGGVMGGLFGAFIAFLVGSVVIAIIFTPIFVGLGVLLDLLLSRNYQKLKSQGKTTGWWGSAGGFSSGGGGFRGFGGGSSGGGGGSGGW